MSRVPLSDSLSGLKVCLCLGVKGSLGSVFCFHGFVVVCSSYVVFSLCIKLLISVCRACIGNCLGLGMNFNPFLRTSFYVSVRVACLASMTKASSSLSIRGLVYTMLRCEIISWSQVCIACMSLFCICLCLCLFSCI